MILTSQSALSIVSGSQTATIVPKTIAQFNQLGAEDQLAVIGFVFTEMGNIITVAAPAAAIMIHAQGILDQIKQMSSVEQTQVMGDLANHADTPPCRSYGSFTTNTKLGFWNQLGQWMNQGIMAPIPKNHQLSPQASAVLKAFQNASLGQQITILRNAVMGMGFGSRSLGSQKKVAAPVVVPTEIGARTEATIAGVTNLTVLGWLYQQHA